MRNGWSSLMNTEWFRERLKERKLSQRSLARLLELDPAAVSLLMRGLRRMSNEEAHAIATILNVATTEVMRQAGVQVTDDVVRVKVMGYINRNHVVTLYPPKTHESVVGPADCPHGTYAMRRQSPGDILDGWLYFVNGSEDDPKAQLHHFCVVAIENGEQLLATLKPGYRAGTFNLINGNGADMVRADCKVVWASRVIWIKPV